MADSPFLLAYYSRAGENFSGEHRVNLPIGNTEVLAGLVQEQLPCDVHRIEPADPYPNDLDATVARNLGEQKADSRPPLANPLGSIEQYDVVLLGSPIWNLRPPMIMATFAEGLDFSGKIVLPFVTSSNGELANAGRAYEGWCRGAQIAQGLSVKGSEVHQAADAVASWLGQTVLS